MPSANTHPPLHQTRHISEPEYFTALRNLLPGCDPLEVDAELTERTKEFSVMFIPEAKQCLEEMETELSHLTTTLQAYDTLFPDGLTNRSGKPQPDPDFISHDRHRQKIVLSLQEILSSCLSTLFRDPLLDKLALLSTMLEGRTKYDMEDNAAAAAGSGSAGNQESPDSGLQPAIPPTSRRKRKQKKRQSQIRLVRLNVAQNDAPT